MKLTQGLKVLASTMLLAGLLTHQVKAEFNRPAQAFINAGELGQALLLGRRGECYAITPAHVIGDSKFSTLLGGAGKLKGEGDLVQTFGYDLSLLHVSGNLANQCGGSPDKTMALDELLSTYTNATISTILDDGSISRLNVTINDVGLIYLRVRIVNEIDEICKGFSGSLLLINNNPVGIILSVESKTGEARVLRYDRAIETIRPFFDASTPSSLYFTKNETYLTKTPNIYGEAIKVLHPGIRVTIIENIKNDDWLHVREEETGNVGYVNKNKLEERN